MSSPLTGWQMLEHIKSFKRNRVLNNWSSIQFNIEHEARQYRSKLVEVSSCIIYAWSKKKGKSDFDEDGISMSDYYSVIEILKEKGYKVVQKPFLFFWKRDYIDLC